MKAKAALSTAVALLLIGHGLISSGCCEEEEKKAAAAADKITALEGKVAQLLGQIADLEPYKSKAASCETDLDGANASLEKLGQQEKLVEQRHQTMKRLLDKLKAVIEAGELSVRIRRGRMVLELPSAVLFQSGKADLSDKGKATLDSVAEVLKEIRDRSFQVAGHTDNVPVSEDNPYGSNWHLSTARAIEVVRYLKEKGVGPRNLSAAGYAQYQPVSANKTAKGKARNRRIEITLMPNLAELPDLSRLEKKLGLNEPAAVAY